MARLLLTLTLLLTLPTYAANILVCENTFASLFHKISRVKNTTTLRKELKVVVTKPIADSFFTDVARALDTGPTGATIELRDVVVDPNVYAVTHTDYLPPFVGVSDGKKQFKAQIRLRRYLLVPKGMAVAELGPPGDYQNVRLADTEGNFVRLEFKVGHPELGPEGKLRQMENVVDKPALVIDRADVDLLLSSPENYQSNRNAVGERTKALTKTEQGKTKPANVAEEVDAILDRIGAFHDQALTKQLVPEVNVSYSRVGYRILFPVPAELRKPDEPETFEVQITVDENIHTTELVTGSKAALQADDRVIEMKIPVDFASRTNEELESLGLLELANIRQAYYDLPPREGTARNRGKRKQVVPPTPPPPKPNPAP